MSNMIPKSLTDSRQIVADQSYVVCARRIRSLEHTVELLMGEGFRRYRYYKTKGYFEAQLLVAREELNHSDVIAVTIQGSDLRDCLDPSQTDVVIYPEEEWKAYTTAMFSDEVVGQADEDFNHTWEMECVKDSWDKGLVQHDRRLPRRLALDLKQDRNWQVYQACRNWYRQQKEAA